MRRPSLGQSSFTRERIAGRTGQAVVFIVAGLALIATMVQCVRQGGGDPAQMTLWVSLGVVPGVLGVVAMRIGYAELRRPVQIRGGVPRDSVAAPAPLHWHPSVADVNSEFERCRKVQSMGATTSLGLAVRGAINESVAGTVRTRVRFVDPPFRVGGTVRMELRAGWDRGSLQHLRPRFHLRCICEDTSVLQLLTSGIECLADLVPHRTDLDHAPGELALALEFRVPSGLPGADLRAPKPVYWELTSEFPDLVPGDPLEQRFFVPVAG